MSNDTDLRAELRECADGLAAAIEHRRRLLEQQIEQSEFLAGQTAWDMLDVNGRSILGDMLAARGQVLASLASLS